MAAIQQQHDQRHLVHKQFNSPIGLYSDQNVKETLDREIKAFGGTGIELDNQYMGKPSNLQNSAVLKMLEEEESERYTGKRNIITTERQSRSRQRCLIDRDTVLKINRRPPKRDYSWPPPPDLIYSSRSRSSSDEQFNEAIRHKHQIDHIKEIFDNGTIFQQQHKKLSTINKINCRKNLENIIINLNHQEENENDTNNKLNYRSRSLNDNFRGNNNNAKSNNELLSNYNLIQTNVNNNKIDDNIKNHDNDNDDDNTESLFVKKKFYLPENEYYIGMVEPTRKYFENLSKKNQISTTIDTIKNTTTSTANKLSSTSDTLLYNERKKWKSTENFIDFHPYCYNNNNSKETRTKHDSSLQQEQQQQIFNSMLKSENNNNFIKVKNTFTPTSIKIEKTIGINPNLRTLSLDRQLNKKKYNNSNNNSFNELPPLKPRREYHKNLPSNNKTKLNLNTNTENYMKIMENSISNEKIKSNKILNRNNTTNFKEISSSSSTIINKMIDTTNTNGNFNNNNNFENCNNEKIVKTIEQKTNLNHIDELKENYENCKIDKQQQQHSYVNNKKSAIKFKISTNNDRKTNNNCNSSIENLIKSNEISYSSEPLPLLPSETTNKEKTLLNLSENFLTSDSTNINTSSNSSSSSSSSRSINKKNDENKMKIFTKNNNDGMQNNKNNIIICNISGDADDSSKNKITKTKTTTIQNDVENINNKNDNKKIVKEIRKNISKIPSTTTDDEIFLENINNNNFIYHESPSSSSKIYHNNNNSSENENNNDHHHQSTKFSSANNKINICDGYDNQINNKENSQILNFKKSNENSSSSIINLNKNLPEMIITSDGINRIVNIINLNQNQIDLQNLTNNNNNKLYNNQLTTITTSSLSSLLLKKSPMYSKDFLYFNNDDKKPYRKMIINLDKNSITQDDNNKKNKNSNENDENLVVKNFLLENNDGKNNIQDQKPDKNILDKKYSCLENKKNIVDISKPTITDKAINIFKTTATTTNNNNNNDNTSKATTLIQQTTTTTNMLPTKPKITKIYYNNKPTKINECLTLSSPEISSSLTTNTNTTTATSSSSGSSSNNKKRHGIYYSRNIVDGNVDNDSIDILYKDNVKTLSYDPKTIDLIYKNNNDDDDDSKEQIHLIDDKLNDLFKQNENNDKKNINDNKFKIKLLTNDNSTNIEKIIENDKQTNENLSNIIHDKYSKIQKSISEDLRCIDRYMESAEKSLLYNTDNIKPSSQIDDNIFIFETPLKKIMKHFMFNNSKYNHHKSISILNDEYTNSYDPNYNQTTENMPVVDSVLTDLYNISLLLNSDNEIMNNNNPLEFHKNDDKTHIIEINDNNNYNIDETLLLEDQSTKDDTIIDSNNTSIITETTLSTNSNSEPITTINMNKIIESKNILSGYLITKQNQEELFIKASSVLQKQLNDNENSLIDLNTNFYDDDDDDGNFPNKIKSITTTTDQQQEKEQFQNDENHPITVWTSNNIKSLKFNDKNSNENYITNNSSIQKLNHKQEIVDDDKMDEHIKQNHYKMMSNKITDNIKFNRDKSLNFDYNNNSGDDVVVNKQIQHQHHILHENNYNSNNEYPSKLPTTTTTHHNNVHDSDDNNNNNNRNETSIQQSCRTMKRSSSQSKNIESDDNNNVNGNNNKSNKIDYIQNNNNNDDENQIEIKQNDLILTTSNHIKLLSKAKVELPKTIKLVEINADNDDEQKIPSPTLSNYDNNNNNNVWEICDNNINNNSILMMPEINFDKQKHYHHKTINRNDKNVGNGNDELFYYLESGENIKTENTNKNNSRIMNSNILENFVSDDNYDDGQCGMLKTSIHVDKYSYNDDNNDGYINEHEIYNNSKTYLNEFDENPIITNKKFSLSRGQSLNRESRSRSRSRVEFIDPSEEYNNNNNNDDNEKPKYQLRCTSQPPPIKHLIKISKDYINYDSRNYLNLYRQYSFDSNINNIDNNNNNNNSSTTLQLYPLDGQYEWTNEGYKRVAWPPADQARTYRAYTPQPTNQQPNQDNNSYQSQPTQSQQQQPQQQHHQQPQQHQQSYPQSQVQQPSQNPSYQPVNQGYQKPNYPGANQPSSQQQGGYQPQQSRPQQQQGGYQPQQSNPQQQGGYQPQQSNPQQQQGGYQPQLSNPQQQQGGYQPQQSRPQQQQQGGYQPQQQPQQQGYQPQKSQPEQGYVHPINQQPSSQQGFVHPSNISQPHSPQPQQPNPYQQQQQPQSGYVPYPHQDNNNYQSPSSHPTASVPSHMNGPGSTVSFTGGVAQRPTQSAGLSQHSPQPKPFQSQYNVPSPSAQSYQPYQQQQQPSAPTGGDEQRRGWTHVTSPAPARTGYNIFQPNMAGGGAPQYGSDSQFGSNQNISSQQQQPTNQAYNQSVPVSHNQQQPLSGQPHFYQQPQQQQNQMHPAQNQYHQQPSPYESQHNQYNQQPQQQYNSQADQQNPGVITLRRETPTHQPPAPVIVSQPATRSFRGKNLGGSIMRGDLKWPPQDCRERMAADAEWEQQLSLGPACRPTKQQKDYSGFFAKHALAHNYPGYKIPPGTQHIEASF